MNQINLIIEHNYGYKKSWLMLTKYIILHVYDIFVINNSLIF